MHHHILLPSKKQTLWLYLGWGQRTTLASTSTSSTGTGTGARPAKKGLGAKKAAPVDFAEAERIRQLGYDCEHEEASVQVARDAAALELKNKSATVSASKLFIAVPKVVILGHRCNYEGRIPDDSKIAKIRDWPGCKPSSKSVLSSASPDMCISGSRTTQR
jgi:hypothetical protein